MSKINCPNCQSSNDATATFCDQCGTPLTGAQQAPPVQAAVAQSIGSAGGDLCPSCGTANMPGEMFCQNCGAQLGMGGQAPSIPQKQPAWQPPPSVGGGISGGVVPPQRAQTGYITAPDGQSIPLAGKSVYLLGRTESVAGIHPDVDTTPSGGEEKAVSRRHAEIFVQQGQWFIRDLNSTNGTWVNNRRLTPSQATPISSTDTLRLGAWDFKFQG